MRKNERPAGARRLITTWNLVATATVVPQGPCLEGDALHRVGVEQRERDGRVGAHRRTEVQLHGVDLQRRHGCGCRTCNKNWCALR